MRASRGKTARLPPRPRVALDTGVLLHALLLSDEKAQRLRRAWQDGACVPLIDAASAQALMRALAYPALKLSAAQQHELLADFLPYAEVVRAAPGVRRGVRQDLAPALDAAEAKRLKLDGVVSDCAARRARHAQRLSRAETVACRLLDSEEFLAAL